MDRSYINTRISMDKPPKELRYEINDWSQVSKCLSNSSKKLKLKYVQINDSTLKGSVIRVEHEKFGCLFSYLVSGRGKLLMESNDGRYHEFTSEEILKELEKFGFYIKFARSYNISGSQIEFLMTLQGLHMDKIRFLDVVMNKNYPQRELVAFNSIQVPNMLDNRYICSENQFKNYLIEGNVLNLSKLDTSKNENWEFLMDKVLDINSILESLEKEVVEC